MIDAHYLKIITPNDGVLGYIFSHLKFSKKGFSFLPLFWLHNFTWTLWFHLVNTICSFFNIIRTPRPYVFFLFPWKKLPGASVQQFQGSQLSSHVHQSNAPNIRIVPLQLNIKVEGWDFLKITSHYRTQYIEGLFSGKAGNTRKMGIIKVTL